MITGIRFSNFVAEPRPESPIGIPTGYTALEEEPVVPVYNQQVEVDELSR